MTFAFTQWLVAAALAVPLLVVAFWLSHLRARRLMRRIADVGLQDRLLASVSLGRNIAKAGLLIAAVVFICVSFARPRWGFTVQEEKIKGIDILIALDTSRSMLAEDIRPDRLQRAKFAIYDLMATLQGDRIGLVAFAGSAFLQCPLTLDYDAFRQTLETIDTDIIPQQGTDIAAAIEEATAAFPKSQNEKLLILISDGEDLEAQGLDAARSAGEAGIRIFTIGVGSEKGELIRVRDAQGRMDFLRDTATGQPVQSRLDAASLMQIAEASGGFYQPITNPDALMRIYEEGLASIPSEERESRIREVPIERFQYPLGMAILLLLLEPLLNNRRRIIRGAKGVAVLLLGALFLLTPYKADAQETAPQEPGQKLAYEAFTKQTTGAYEEAEELYAQAIAAAVTRNKIAEWHYNRGLVLLELKRYEDAAEAFTNAQQTSDLKLLADAYYNYGVALLNQVVTLRETDPALAIGIWNQALAAFYQVVQLEPESAETYSQLVRDFLNEVAQLRVVVNDAAGGKAGESGRYLKDTTVKLTAKANKGWRFGGWTGAEVADATAEETEFVIKDNVTVQADFIKVWPLELFAEPEYAGQAGEKGEYDADAPAPIMAAPIDGYAFAGWEGEGVQDAQNPQTAVLMDGPKKVTAIFKRTHTLVVRAEKPGTAELTGTGDYGMGERVPISVTPAQGYLFDYWEGDVVDDPYAAETFVTATGLEQDIVAILKKDPDQQEEGENQENQDQQEQEENQQQQDQSQDGQEKEDGNQQEQDEQQQGDEEGADQQQGEDEQGEQQQAGQDEGAEEETEQASAEEGQQDDGEPEGEQQQAVPAGAMTRAEAVRLLEALKESERKLPSRAPVNNQGQREGRNW